MKFTAALCILALSTCAITAPVSGTPNKVPSRADLFKSVARQEPRARLPAVKTPARQPVKISEKKGSKAEKLHSYITSLAHRLTNKPPFSESSIVREETRASTEDWESEASIVEWETKASREAYFWIPCLSADKTLSYHRVRVNTDMLVVSLVLSLIAIIVIIELWKPVAARFSRLRSGHGPIYLDNDEVTSKESIARKLSISSSCEPTLEVNFESKPEPSQVEITSTR
ncbi:hypothetical protein O1611_g1043 [Lasiodiplodia mahajangana]|uniref:Uncharacterized protein n=1 Tax=Lasiodiplodia mahajangana TaxID=1108764 RepID=A0ACC2JZ04_9PEZI|nr:hypothetical protein O1611_g1043 [Lasiodiplodia mahajangana]